MKIRNILIILLCLIFFSSCQVNKSQGSSCIVSSKENISIGTSVSTSTDKSDKISSTTSVSKISNNLYNDSVGQMLQALIDKDESVLKDTMSYIESESGYLYSVDFSGYQIVDEYDVLLWNNKYRNYVVNLDITNSRDNRFKIGKTQWNVGICFVEIKDSCQVNCIYFLPVNINPESIYDRTLNNKVADLAYNFSYSFNGFKTVDNIQEFPREYENEDFTDRFQTFMFGIQEKPENKVYTYDFADEILKKYFGIEQYKWDTNIEYFGVDLWKRWDMTSVYAIINNQSNNYIDMTYFADSVYLTPAKQMRYYFKQNDDNIQLTGTELLKDYGYEPNWEIN